MQIADQAMTDQKKMRGFGKNETNTLDQLFGKGSELLASDRRGPARRP
jgi:hypothetical protein